MRNHLGVQGNLRGCLRGGHVPADGVRLGYVGLSIWDVSSEKKLTRGLPTKPPAALDMITGLSLLHDLPQAEPTYMVSRTLSRLDELVLGSAGSAVPARSVCGRERSVHSRR
jgi:hypothetical protein